MMQKVLINLNTKLKIFYFKNLNTFQFFYKKLFSKFPSQYYKKYTIVYIYIYVKKKWFFYILYILNLFFNILIIKKN